MGRNKKRRFEAVDEDDGPQIRKKPNTGEELPPGIFHYREISEVPWDTQKYAYFSLTISFTRAY